MNKFLFSVAAENERWHGRIADKLIATHKHKVIFYIYMERHYSPALQTVRKTDGYAKPGWKHQAHDLKEALESMSYNDKRNGDIVVG